MRVAIWDQHCAWSRSLNRERLHGGGEIHMVQLAEGLALRGHEVVCYTVDGRGIEGGVRYEDSRLSGHLTHDCDALIVQTDSEVQGFFRAGRTVTHQIHDPRPCRERWAHFEGRRELVHVCVSRWDAGLFDWLGGRAVCIHPPLDVSAQRGREALRIPTRFVCCASWNKGTDRTLELWVVLSSRLPGAELCVSSPYSEPDDAAARCERAGARWVGRLVEDVPELIATAGAGLFMVNEHPETFGITPAFARLLDLPVYILCLRELGGLPEACGGGELATTDRARFEQRLFSAWAGEHVETYPPAPDLSLAHVLDQWEELLRP